jgi:hypothetical protein
MGQPLESRNPFKINADPRCLRRPLRQVAARGKMAGGGLVRTVGRYCAIRLKNEYIFQKLRAVNRMDTPARAFQVFSCQDSISRGVPAT